MNELSFCRLECYLSLLAEDGLDHSKSTVSMRSGKSGAQDKLGPNVALCSELLVFPLIKDWYSLPSWLRGHVKQNKKDYFYAQSWHPMVDIQHPACRAGVRFSNTVPYFLCISSFSQGFLLLLHFQTVIRCAAGWGLWGQLADDWKEYSVMSTSVMASL